MAADGDDDDDKKKKKKKAKKQNGESSSSSEAADIRKEGIVLPKEMFVNLMAFMQMMKDKAKPCALKKKKSTV